MTTYHGAMTIEANKNYYAFSANFKRFEILQDKIAFHLEGDDCIEYGQIMGSPYQSFGVALKGKDDYKADVYKAEVYTHYHNGYYQISTVTFTTVEIDKDKNTCHIVGDWKDDGGKDGYWEFKGTLIKL